MRFSRARARMRSQLIAELLRLASRPDVLSLAGGVPAPELFPLPELKAAAQRALERHGAAALQYSPTEGHPVLRRWVAEGLGVSEDQVLITSGSQQVIDLVARVLLDEGDPVAVELPTYMGGLLAMNPYAPRYLGVPADARGLVPGGLPERAKLLYLLPNFQNPTGAVLAADRREAVAEWARERDAVVLEDDPYGHIYFEDPPPPPVFSLAPERTVYAGTFSKLVAPGLRVGYAVAPVELIEALAQAKQAADLHTNILGQAIIAELIESGAIAPQAERVRDFYRRRRDQMVSALRRHLPPEVRFDVPAGGMFLWLRFPPGTDTRRLLELALEEGVAFVPGEPFFAADGYPAARLTFASVPEEAIEEGVRRLSRAYVRYLEDPGAGRDLALGGE